MTVTDWAMTSLRVSTPWRSFDSSGSATTFTSGSTGPVFSLMSPLIPSPNVRWIIADFASFHRTFVGTPVPLRSLTPRSRAIHPERIHAHAPVPAPGGAGITALAASGVIAGSPAFQVGSWSDAAPS